ncbi:MAG: PDZ domain-containing protein [Planctomycetota bacterium]|nr:MAG: PDZ domain-containing protein [Planctomycetota bacterium]
MPLRSMAWRQTTRTPKPRNQPRSTVDNRRLAASPHSPQPPAIFHPRCRRMSAVCHLHAASRGFSRGPVVARTNPRLPQFSGFMRLPIISHSPVPSSCCLHDRKGGGVRVLAGWWPIGCLLATWLAWGATVPAQAQTTDSTTGSAPRASLLDLQSATTEAIARAEKSVVAIARVRRDRSPTDRTRLSPLRVIPFVADPSPLDPDFVPTHYGSGVIISSDGFIVTCAHVVDDPRLYDYYVWTAGQGFPAEVVARPAKAYASDPFSDLAVLKISADGLTPIRFGDTGQLRRGQFVIALGNPEAVARDGRPTASFGIISNLNRVAPSEGDDHSPASRESIHQFGTLIQTDVRVAIGSSGGALVNLDGEMVGLLTSLVALSGLERPAGFAIAADDLFQRVIERMKLGELPEFGFLGIQPEDLRLHERMRGLRGARVVNVIAGLPGQEAGLQPDDIIFRVGQESVDSRNDLFRALSRVAPGTRLPIYVYRIQRASNRLGTQRLEARISKKHIGTSRPAYALNPPQQWRGIAVEYATALPVDPFRRPGPAPVEMPDVAVLSVEPQSPAWEAGVRPGAGIRTLNGKTIRSPQDFYTLADAVTGPAELELVRTDGTTVRVTIPPQVD